MIMYKIRLQIEKHEWDEKTLLDVEEREFMLFEAHSDAEAICETLENIMKIIGEFRE